MTDIVATVPMRLWDEWIAEGDLPGEPWTGEAEYHFWINPAHLPRLQKGDRLYIVAYGKVRGYAPIVRCEKVCRIAMDRACLVRHGEAEAVTISEPVRGFQGWRYRWWDRLIELPFPDWRKR